MIQSREELQWVKLQGVGLPPHRGVGVWHLGCWDLNPWHSRLPKVNGFLVTLLLQQKILELEISWWYNRWYFRNPKVLNHLEYVQKPLGTDMTCTTLRAPRLRWFRAEVPKVQGMKGWKRRESNESTKLFSNPVVTVGLLSILSISIS